MADFKVSYQAKEECKTVPIDCFNNQLKIIKKNNISKETSSNSDDLYINQPVEKIIGINTGLKEIFNQVNKIFSTDENVLITGETGTGKEIIARTIHSLSNRKNFPFIKINCGALPDSLIESELFGYKKGAFSHAYNDKPGKIELADGGTLFMDEIGELKPEMQTRLLNVIQEKITERLGCNKLNHINFRLICATNIDLKDSIKKKKFREDLFYRINTFNIHLPALRNRKEDIKQFVEYYIYKYSNEYNKSNIRIDNESMEILMKYRWPGNIRELKSAVKRAIIMLDDDKKTITCDSFDCLNEYKTRHKSSIKRTFINMAKIIINNKCDFNEIEKNLLKYILKYFDGNIAEAVKSTGISKNRFYRIEK